MIWSHTLENFTAVHSDIMTQLHMNNSGGDLPIDYDMYLPYRLLPNQVGFIKVYRSNATQVDPKPDHDRDAVLTDFKLTFLNDSSTDAHFQYNRSDMGN